MVNLEEIKDAEPTPSSISTTASSVPKTATETTTAAVSGGPLGTLSVFPREIRDRIYEYVLDFDTNIHRYLGRSKSEAHSADRLKNPQDNVNRFPRLGICCASKQLYEESFRVIFTSNNFTLTVLDGRHYTSAFPGVLESWQEKNGQHITVKSTTAFSIGDGRPPLPKKLKNMAGLIKHWTVTFHTYFAVEGKPEDRFDSFSETCDMTVSFLKENTKPYSLEVGINYYGDVDPRKTADVKDIGIEALLTLRGLSNFSVDCVKDCRGFPDEIRLSPEFTSYIENTVKLSAGTKADLFEGDRYTFLEPVPEDDDDDDDDDDDNDEFDTMPLEFYEENDIASDDSIYDYAPS